MDSVQRATIEYGCTWEVSKDERSARVARGDNLVQL